MTCVAVTVDLDWASEVAIEETLGFLQQRGIPVTVFATHRSGRVEAAMREIEIGLHPFFGAGSSHGDSIGEVVRHVLDLPHNFPAFRCHRFAVSNEAREAMAAAGMRISSNTCTDLEVVPPFMERCGLVEVPIFLEDGAYLRRGHSLHAHVDAEGAMVLLVHPMHFAINTPHIGYMDDIKRTASRKAWNGMSRATLDGLRWRGRGIRDFVADLLLRTDTFTTVGALAQVRLNRECAAHRSMRTAKSNESMDRQ